MVLNAEILDQQMLFSQRDNERQSELQSIIIQGQTECGALRSRIMAEETEVYELRGLEQRTELKARALEFKHGMLENAERRHEQEIIALRGRPSMPSTGSADENKKFESIIGAKNKMMSVMNEEVCALRSKCSALEANSENIVKVSQNDPSKGLEKLVTSLSNQLHYEENVCSVLQRQIVQNVAVTPAKRASLVLAEDQAASARDELNAEATEVARLKNENLRLRTGLVASLPALATP